MEKTNSFNYEFDKLIPKIKFHYQKNQLELALINVVVTYDSCFLVAATLTCVPK